MKKLIVTLIALLSISGCQKIECPAFDFNHPINKWHWFPDNEQNYQFVGIDSSTITLTQTRFQFNRFEERNCHQCACFSDLDTYYDFVNLGIQLRSLVSYQSGESSDEGSLYFGIDNIGSPFDPEELTISEVEIENYESQEFNVTLLDTLTIVDSTYFNVTQLAVLDTSKTDVRKVWIVPNSGVVGLQIHDKHWRKK